MEGVEEVQKTTEKWYHKFESWAKKHPYGAGLAVAATLAVVYWISGKLTSDTAATTTTSGGVSSTPGANSGFTSTGTNSTGYSSAELAAASAAAKQDIANQVAAASEEVRQQVLSNQSVQNAASTNPTLNTFLNKLSSGDFSKLLSGIFGGAAAGSVTTSDVLARLYPMVAGGIPGQSGIGADLSSILTPALAGETVYNPGVSSVNSYLPDYQQTYQETQLEQINSNTNDYNVINVSSNYDANKDSNYSNYDYSSGDYYGGAGGGGYDFSADF